MILEEKNFKKKKGRYYGFKKINSKFDIFKCRIIASLRYTCVGYGSKARFSISDDVFGDFFHG